MALTGVVHSSISVGLRMAFCRATIAGAIIRDSCNCKEMGGLRLRFGATAGEFTFRAV